MPEMSDPDILDAEQLAARLRWSVKTVLKAARSGTIPGIQPGPGGPWRFSWTAVQHRLGVPATAYRRPR